MHLRIQFSDVAAYGLHYKGAGSMFKNIWEPNEAQYFESHGGPYGPSDLMPPITLEASGPFPSLLHFKANVLY